jgi:hypothetical protein
MCGIEVINRQPSDLGGQDRKPAYFVANARPNGNMRHALTAEQGNPVKNRNTVVWPLCCKHEALFLSAKAGHWEKS